ncbi:hypothetical protein EHLJMEHL_04319 [Vreelandella titanicae]|uniref:Uncharacterized protein n=1 Tax=Vreelandella titanicae TaxID=664683 RepID=A0AAP9SY56_9GAMM|nr:hypothetical protein FX987_00119 [Halomonas titanicae]
MKNKLDKFIGHGTELIGGFVMTSTGCLMRQHTRLFKQL